MLRNEGLGNHSHGPPLTAAQEQERAAAEQRMTPTELEAELAAERAAFRAWAPSGRARSALQSRLGVESALRGRFELLRGADLACWCHTERQVRTCHARELARMLNGDV